MQAEEIITLEQLHEIFNLIYGIEEVVVKESYSQFDKPAQIFANQKELIKHFLEDKNFKSYAIYYPLAKGKVFEKTIILNPEKCNGHTTRYAQEGWGIIFIQCEFKEEKIKCRISVNSEKRAQNWEPTYPELGQAIEWDWVVIKKLAGKLTRTLIKLGKLA